MSDEIAERVVAALVKVKRLPREQIHLDSPLQELGIDSLDTVVLLSELEEQFKIAISDDDARSIRSVRDIVEGVKRLSGSLRLDAAASTD